MGGVAHNVMQGETLYRIAKMYHVEVSALMRANHIDNPARLEPGHRLVIPSGFVRMPYKPPFPYKLENVRKIVGPRNETSIWKTITLHHSATLQGSARLFDRDHRRRKMGGLFYHFVLGNGTTTADGSIEVGWRWKKQVPANRPYDIQICLVGNFDEQHVSEAQLNSLVSLIRILMEEYGIPTSTIRQHRDIPGKHTDCPGKKFPFQSVINRVNNPSFSTD